jgi:dynein heavy chain
MVNVSFTAGKHSATAQGYVLDDDTIECKTPDVVATIGPKRCEVRLAIGVRDFTTTKTVYDYYLNTQPDKSMCYGPGLLEEGQADLKTSFLIQARNMNGENRKSGADEYVISVRQDNVEIEFEKVDYDNGRYEIFYTPAAGEVKIDVKLVNEFEKAVPIRGSPFKATFVPNAKPRANEMAGPLMLGFIPKTLKEVEDFNKTCDAGISLPLKDGDVHSLIKVMNNCTSIWTNEDYLQRRMDEVEEVLAMMAREGMPNEKAGKQLKKIKDSIDGLKEKVRTKQKEIEPMRRRSRRFTRRRLRNSRSR